MEDSITNEEGKRTKDIPVKQETNEPVTFDLGISKAKDKPVFGQSLEEQAQDKPQDKPLKTKPSNFIARKSNKFFWNILEWLTTSAVIFMIFFIFLNWGSYSELFFSKVAQIQGTATENSLSSDQAAQDKIRNVAPENQTPLPIVRQESEQKKQIPDLNLEITPPDDRIIINRIGKSVPIVRVSAELLIKKDWDGLESQIQEALKYGVVHFPGTALPGMTGNVVLTGHSSYFPWDPGRFKDVFALLHQVSIGDEVIVYYNQGKFRYIIYDKVVVNPDQVEVLTQKGENRLTLITCTPVGTNLRRLVVMARPIQ